MQTSTLTRYMDIKYLNGIFKAAVQPAGICLATRENLANEPTYLFAVALNESV